MAIQVHPFLIIVIDIERPQLITGVMDVIRSSIPERYNGYINASMFYCSNGSRQSSITGWCKCYRWASIPNSIGAIQGPE
jgi:hypothetical protein